MQKKSDKVLQSYEGQSKIAEPYLITFYFAIVDNKCEYVL